jgi:16S rRNA (guanine(966)-N(2))-methyltransferase RsmD
MRPNVRVISGEARGRRLRTVADRSVRPTADRVKEALFSIIASRFPLAGAEILDLFAGSGGLGIEALSRGARHATFVERDAASRRVLVGNLELCRFSARATIEARAVTAVLRDWAARGQRADGVLLDPPYCRGWVAATLEQLGAGAVVAAGGWVAVEHHVDEAPPESADALRLTVSRRYGKTGLALFTVAADVAGTRGS